MHKVYFIHLSTLPFRFRPRSFVFPQEKETSAVSKKRSKAPEKSMYVRVFACGTNRDVQRSLGYLGPPPFFLAPKLNSKESHLFSHFTGALRNLPQKIYDTLKRRILNGWRWGAKSRCNTWVRATAPPKTLPSARPWIYIHLFFIFFYTSNWNLEIWKKMPMSVIIT